MKYVPRIWSYALSVLPMIATLGAPTPSFAAPPSELLSGQGMPYAAFDRMPHTVLHVNGATLQVGFAPGELALPTDRILRWIEHSASVVVDYYGRFPVATARILIVPVDGRGIRGGTTWGYQGAAIRLVVGSQADEDDLQQDWKIVHEMVHLALPDLDRRHNWLSEGLATYIEPIARAQAGDLTATSVWAAMLRDMPKGLPQADDRGLDLTHSWGRTYWGGAIFCLLADVRIRKETANRVGLQDAMRGVLAAGGNHEQDWPIERVLSAGDKATGTHVLSLLYAQMATAPIAPDLDGLWRDLGVKLQANGEVIFDDAAPLAKTRMAIMQRKPASAEPSPAH